MYVQILLELSLSSTKKYNESHHFYHDFLILALFGSSWESPYRPARYGILLLRHSKRNAVHSCFIFMIKHGL
jgi:hypothetical protein